MLKVTVKEAARARGITTYYQLGQELAPKKKLTAAQKAKYEMMAKRLWEGNHVPTLPTLEVVCDALDCELSDLIVRNGKRRKK